MRRLFLFVPLVLAIALGIVLASGIGKNSQEKELESALIGKPVPNFSLGTLENPQELRRADLFKGKTQFLNVWGTWCPSCRVEHPELMRLAKDEGIPIVGLDYKDNRNEALKWLEQRGDPYTVNLFDPQGKLGFDLGVYGAPETFLIDSQGIVRHRHVGVVNEKVWKETLEPLYRKYRSRE